MMGNGETQAKSEGQMKRRRGRRKWMWMRIMDHGSARGVVTGPRSCNRSRSPSHREMAMATRVARLKVPAIHPAEHLYLNEIWLGKPAPGVVVTVVADRDAGVPHRAETGRIGIGTGIGRSGGGVDGGDWVEATPRSCPGASTKDVLGHRSRPASRA